MEKLKVLAFVLILLGFASCQENYSNGERIGVITQFSKTGVVFKSYEGHLNVTQTGMNSSVPFDFSIDNDETGNKENTDLIMKVDSAAQFGWKVKLIYHETFGKNLFNNRGQTNHFIVKCEVLERNFGNAFNGKSALSNITKGRVDTIYVVIDRSRSNK